MAALKHKVTLLAPTIGNTIRKDPFSFYGVPRSFTIEHVPMFDALSSKLIPGRFAFAVAMRSYKKSLKKYLRESSFDLLYARSPAILPALLSSGIPVFLELHTLPRRGRKRFVKQCNACAKVVCLTSPMRHELVQWGVDAKRVIVEGDAVDIKRFKNLPAIKTAKHEWNLPADRVIIGYVGSLVTFDSLKKGVDVILDAALLLRKQKLPVFAWFVGGPSDWKEKYRKLALTKGLSSHDMRFDEAVFASSVPEVLQACDICIYPAPASKHVFFRRDTSPLKLFEYLAAGKPSIVADIPPVRDVVDATSVKFFHPGSATSLAGALREVMNKKAEAAKRAKNGKTIAEHHTWEKRMEKILKTAPKPKKAKK